MLGYTLNPQTRLLRHRTLEEGELAKMESSQAVALLNGLQF
jgi:hypothetical protein